MMDLKELIRWFLPCFHILLSKKTKTNFRLALICLFLLFNFCVALEAKTNSDSDPNRTFLVKNSFNFSSYGKNNNINTDKQMERSLGNEYRSLDAPWSGRTFGRPFKKMMAGLLPIVFSMGAASTWAMVATIVGIKTLFVTLVILKLLLVAGAAKVGALFGAKTSHLKHQEAWSPTPHQKEIHLHIHNGHQETHHETETGPYPSSWSREGVPVQTTSAETKTVNLALDSAYSAGPQTISTPYGNYVKVEPARVRKKRHT